MKGVIDKFLDSLSFLIKKGIVEYHFKNNFLIGINHIF
jgi:hypothetical protein